MLRYQDFLNRAVDESIKGANVSYGQREDAKGKAMLSGAVAGLTACRDLSPPQLAMLLVRARRVQQIAMRQHTVIERYWRVNCFMGEVEWICNVVSCVLVHQNFEPIIPPTMRAAQLAARISQEQSELTN